MNAEQDEMLTRNGHPSLEGEISELNILNDRGGFLNSEQKVQESASWWNKS